MFDKLDAELLEAFGSVAIYSSTGKAPVELRILIRQSAEPFDSGFVTDSQTHALIANRSVSPSAGDTIQIGKTSYTVSALISDDGSLMRLLVV